MMFPFAKKTMVTPSGTPPHSWQTALIRRFAAFLHTAFPFRLPAIKAARPPIDMVRSCCVDTMKVMEGL